MSDAAKGAVAMTVTVCALLGAAWFGSGDATSPADEHAYGRPTAACWDRMKNVWLRDHPRCAFRGCRSPSGSRVEVHHVQPVSMRPDLECDLGNYVTLCREGENHHLWVGHQGSFAEANVNVREDCARGRFPEIGLDRKRRHDARVRAYGFAW